MNHLNKKLIQLLKKMSITKSLIFSIFPHLESKCLAPDCLGFFQLMQSPREKDQEFLIQLTCGSMFLANWLFVQFFFWRCYPLPLLLRVTNNIRKVFKNCKEKQMDLRNRLFLNFKRH